MMHLLSYVHPKIGVHAFFLNECISGRKCRLDKNGPKSCYSTVNNLYCTVLKSYLNTVNLPNRFLLL